MFEIAYITNGILNLIWYICLRWTFLPFKNVFTITKINNTPIFQYIVQLFWTFQPINLITALFSIPFLITALFMPQNMHNSWWHGLCIFLIIRNAYYSLEDIIDLINTPSKKQFGYVLLDLSMLTFTILCFYKFYNND